MTASYVRSKRTLAGLVANTFALQPPRIAPWPVSALSIGHLVGDEASRGFGHQRGHAGRADFLFELRCALWVSPPHITAFVLPAP